MHIALFTLSILLNITLVWCVFAHVDSRHDQIKADTLALVLTILMIAVPALAYYAGGLK